MTVTLHLTPEVEASLLVRAHAAGMPWQNTFFPSLKTQLNKPPPPSTAPTKREEAVRRMFEFGEKHYLTPGQPITCSLLHEGHRR